MSNFYSFLLYWNQLFYVSIIEIRVNVTPKIKRNVFWNKNGQFYQKHLIFSKIINIINFLFLFNWGFLVDLESERKILKS